MSTETENGRLWICRYRGRNSPRVGWMMLEWKSSSDGRTRNMRWLRGSLGTTTSTNTTLRVINVCDKWCLLTHSTSFWMRRTWSLNSAQQYTHTHTHTPRAQVYQHRTHFVQFLCSLNCVCKCAKCPNFQVPFKLNNCFYHWSQVQTVHTHTHTHTSLVANREPTKLPVLNYWSVTYLCYFY